MNLDGTESSDPDEDSLTYQWEITTRPTGSTAALQNATAVRRRLSSRTRQDRIPLNSRWKTTVDAPDTDSVTVTAGSGPVADAGADQQVSLGATVTLNGGDSVNPERDAPRRA